VICKIEVQHVIRVRVRVRVWVRVGVGVRVRVRAVVVVRVVVRVGVRVSSVLTRERHRRSGSRCRTGHSGTLGGACGCCQPALTGCQPLTTSL
jgi:hypothetical protein